MSFLSSLKRAKNFVTGGGADVSVNVIDPSLSEIFTVIITAQANQQLEIDKVYLTLRCQEEQEYEVTNEEGEREEEEDVRTLFKQTFPFSDALVMEEGQKLQWQRTIDLRDVELPASYEEETYDGEYEIEWKAFAGLDVSGNDPDSGWIEFEMGA
ncbi:MAG: hypothetical protein HQL53_01175 [Magnetococcales bacterium]|nr:hypothetical protein [Magnetococcales bacterium]